ncbi:hypothetical protein KI387_002481, partial [Taxus chinensis]
KGSAFETRGAATMTSSPDHLDEYIRKTIESEAYLLRHQVDIGQSPSIFKYDCVRDLTTRVTIKKSNSFFHDNIPTHKINHRSYSLGQSSLVDTMGQINYPTLDSHHIGSLETHIGIASPNFYASMNLSYPPPSIPFISLDSFPQQSHFYNGSVNLQNLTLHNLLPLKTTNYVYNASLLPLETTYDSSNGVNSGDPLSNSPCTSENSVQSGIKYSQQRPLDPTNYGAIDIESDNAIDIYLGFERLSEPKPSVFGKKEPEYVKYDPQQKQAALERYRLKRPRRNHEKTIKYNCRKDLAEKRTRMGGRFVTEGGIKLRACSSQVEDKE